MKYCLFYIIGKQDGFYASRWCNVFYRCYTGIASAFLCPKMPSGARLWWVQHGSPQGIAQETAACTWPCETGRRCSSSGGIIVDSGSTVSESQQEAETVFSQSLCTTSSSFSFNPGSSGSSGSSTGDVLYHNHLSLVDHQIQVVVEHLIQVAVDHSVQEWKWNIFRCWNNRWKPVLQVDHHKY